MRTIKFRAKSLHTGEWHYGDLIQPEDDAVFIQERGTAGFLSDPKTVGQFVGLQDKHRNDIFEGDIISQDYNAYNGPDEMLSGTHIGVARLTSQGAVMNPCNTYDDESDKIIFRPKYKKICGNRASVIGNIFDNPELLEGGTE